MINRIESPLLNFKVYKICLKMNKDRDTSYRNSIQLKISKIIFFKRNFVYFKNKLLIFNVAKKKRLDNKETCLDPMTNIDKFVKVEKQYSNLFPHFQRAYKQWTETKESNREMKLLPKNIFVLLER